MNEELNVARCACGRVRCEAVGQPFVTTVCYCSDCQAGGLQIEALGGRAPVRDPDGGTPYLTYREDRFACVEGAELLVGYKLSEQAPTQRFVASCCNSGMFVKYGPGWWISAYRMRFAEPLPPIEMRNKIARRHSNLPLPADVPAHRHFPGKLYRRLIMARIAMLMDRFWRARQGSNLRPPA